ncbi:MAG: tetratricopeptide (TPR) repeat protein, partial [Myxococcota bacterium]
MTDRSESGHRFDEATLAELEGEVASNPEQLPQVVELWRELTAQAFTTEDLQELAARALGLVDRVIESEPAPAVLGILLEHKSNIFDQLGDYRAAQELRVQAFDALPSEEVLSALADGLTLETEPQAALLDLRVRLATVPARRAEAARTLGVLRHGMGDFDAAEFLFNQVLEVDPDDGLASELLESIASARNAFADRVDQLRAEVDLVVAEEQGPDAASAAHLALAEALLDDDPESKDGLKALEKAAAAAPSNGEAAERLIACLVANRKFAPARRVGEEWLAAVDAADRPAALRVVGLALVEGIRHRDFMVETLAEAVVHYAADGEVVDALDLGMTELKQFESLAGVLQAARRATRNRAHDRRWLVREAEIQWRHIGDMEAAERMFRRARAADPRDLTALAFFEHQLNETEDWKRLHAVLSQKFALVEPAARVDVAIQMAEVAEHKLESPDKAIEAYKRVLSEDPGNSLAVDKLAELYEKAGKWHALIDFLNSQSRKLGTSVEANEHKVALLFRIIDIYQDSEKLPVEEMVIHTYNRVVQLSPTN